MLFITVQYYTDTLEDKTIFGLQASAFDSVQLRSLFSDVPYEWDRCLH